MKIKQKKTPKKQLTLAGPTPTNISRNSEPLTVIKGTLASPAVAFANNVFPVPGGPVRIAPLGKKIKNYVNPQFTIGILPNISDQYAEELPMIT